jgi:hypothetical protein
MRKEHVYTDVTVLGGGLAGVSAAIAAARQGCSVALVQNRPVLGGNSSSEVRVWVCGATATGRHRFARETGIIGELLVENQYTNPEGNPYLWDLVLLEAVKNQPQIQLFLNTDVHEVEAEGDEDQRQIKSVTGWMTGSEREIRFISSMYLDCTGDGLPGFLAGAKYRIGREASSEYQEEWAPEEADDITLGSTLLFYTKDAGRPVRFTPPGFAKDITQTDIPVKRVIRSGDSGCYYWWIEWGGELDTVHENETIRDELWSVIYGIWDYIKNSGQFEAENMTLEWVGSIPGKREYRRFVGEYVLNQNDIISQTPFKDRIGFGGWSIDLHPPQGMYANESGSKHMHANGNYHIPFRSLYSVNVMNLLFAGRNISASHVAFGTTRVMATCAVTGEAAGAGAALCVKGNMTPQELCTHHLDQLQQALLKEDASILGIKNVDPADYAKEAHVLASSWLSQVALEQHVQVHPLNQDAGILLPVDPRLDGLELLVSTSESTMLTLELWGTGQPQNYVPVEPIQSIELPVAQGTEQWVHAPLQYEPSKPCNVFLVIRANPNVNLHLSPGRIPGLLSFSRKNTGVTEESGLYQHRDKDLIIQWPEAAYRMLYCMKLSTGSLAFCPEKVTDGYKRPYGGPHLWVSDSMQADCEPWLELIWERRIEIREIQLTFNDDVHEDLVNLHYKRTPFDVIPELVRDYRVEVWDGSCYQTLLSVCDNRKRTRKHKLNQPLVTNRLRLVIEATNGCPSAEVVEIRVY